MKKLGRILALCALGTGAVTTTTSVAHAAAVNCKVNIVEYSKDTLLIQCVGGVNYYAQIAPGGTCGPQATSMDTIKAWLSMGQTALLAAKPLLLYFNSCDGFNFINVIDLNR